MKKNGEMHRTQELVMDTFKILCLLVRETTAARIKNGFNHNTNRFATYQQAPKVSILKNHLRN